MTKPFFQFGTTPFETVDPFFILSNGVMPDQDDYSKIYAAGNRVTRLIDKVTDAAEPYSALYLKIFNDILTPEFKTTKQDVVKNMMEDLRKNVIGVFGASSWDDISAKVCSEEERASGNQHNTWKKEGYISFFKYLVVSSHHYFLYLSDIFLVHIEKESFN